MTAPNGDYNTRGGGHGDGMGVGNDTTAGDGDGEGYGFGVRDGSDAAVFGGQAYTVGRCSSPFLPGVGKGYGDGCGDGYGNDK